MHKKWKKIAAQMSLEFENESHCGRSENIS